VENTTRWTPWLRTVVGIREEYYKATDHSFIDGFQGTQNQTLFQPKGSLIIGPIFQTEFYVSAGRGFHSDDVRGVFGTVPLEGVPALAGKTPLMAYADGYEVGMRTNITPRLQAQVAVFEEDFVSELAYSADAGNDSASAPSRRQGIEVSAQYHPFHWLELNTDLAFSKPRYTGDLTNFGLSGPYIESAPNFIGSFGILVDNLGPWFGGFQWRDLGAFPISDGQKNPQDPGYSQFNADVGYRVNEHLKLQATAFNLSNTKANAGAFLYTGRLRGEPVDGVEDFQNHPLEPLSGNIKVTWTF
jgi:outer membrane receptor protein involved in Fe transport